MSVSFTQRVSVLAVSALALSAGTLSAQQRSAEICYAEEDTECLREIAADFRDNPTPEKVNANYLMGLLQRDGGNLTRAKNTFMIGSNVEEGYDSYNAMHALYESNPEVFTEPLDCLYIENEACFMKIIETGDKVYARNAKSYFAYMLIDSDPPRAADLYEQAFAEGEINAACPLRDLYAEGASGVSPDEDKSAKYDESCLD